MTRRRASLVLLLVALFFPAGAFAAPKVSRGLKRSYELEQARRYAEALQAFETIPAAQRSGYFFQLRLGWLRYLAGKYVASIEAYSSAVAQQRGAVEPLLGLMLPQMAHRRWEDALATARRALRLNRNHPVAMRQMAWILFNLGRFGEAERTYRAVLRDYPGDLEMQLGLAWALLRQHNNAAARRLFAAVLALKPADSSAAQGLQLATQQPTARAGAVP